ncbi:hypothetical protein SteCoe_30146 [Stentor coeruleus]|uniref:Uncharacterized protein n=1 Tax=Stentor coeruleus TaxID=5963 RepID=A0A1R2B486_9CILI|nr:hypothetical protein SteCoe_30146 [Stentor coeruleus]
MPCSYGSCSERPDFYCTCKGYRIEVCKGHSGEHCAEPGQHKLSKLYSLIEENQKGILLEIMSQKLTSFIDLKSKVLSITNNLVKYIYQQGQKSLDLIQEAQNELYQHIKSLNISNEILQTTYENLMKLEGLEFILDTALLDYSSISTEIENFYSKNFLSSIKIQHPDTKNYTTIISYFARNSKNLITFNVATSNYESVIIDIEKPMGNCAGWCLLPEKKVFYYGGQKNALYAPLDTCCIIDPETNKLEMKKKGPIKLYNIGLCSYFEDNVYMFGGLTNLGCIVANSYKFSIENDTWTSIAPLPYPSGFISSALVSGNIMITGKMFTLLMYNPQTNTYLDKVSKAEYNKFMLPYGYKFFLFCKRILIEGDLVSCEYINKKTIIPEDSMLKCYPVLHLSWIYFVLNDENLYRLNVRNKEIENLGRLKGSE